ncbi:ArnT family glycosyltransferase [Acidobacteriota bacterium]
MPQERPDQAPLDEDMPDVVEADAFEPEMQESEAGSRDLQEDASGRPGRFQVFIAIVLLLAAMFLQCVLSMSRKNATYDEVPHLAAGYTYLARRDFRMNTEHPPLIKLLSGAAIMPLNPGIPDSAETYWRNVDMWAQWHFGWLFLYDDPKDRPPERTDQLLFFGRLPVVILGLALALLVYAWAAELYGRKAGLFAMTLCAFSPNVVAHSRLVTTDLGITFFWFASLFAFYHLIKRRRPLYLLIFGLVSGLTLAVKFSGFTAMIWIVPLTVLWILTAKTGRPLTQENERADTSGRRFVHALLGGAAVIILSWFTLWGCYGFRFNGCSTEAGLPETLWKSALAGDEGLTRSAVVWAKDYGLMPEAYLNGFSYVMTRRKGRISYVNGEINREGRWYYFLLTFVLKTPVPLLVFLIALASTAVRPARRLPFSPEVCLLLPLVCIFIMSSASRVNIGHRHILPIYPLLYVLLAGLVPRLAGFRPWKRWIFGVLILWYIGSALFIFPNYLAYFNEIAGGPRNGHKWLLDSNLDWGQDLKQLKRYMDQEGIKEIKLSYFGNAPPAYYGIRANLLPCYVQRDIPPPIKGEWLDRDGVFAVSANMYEGLFNSSIFLPTENGEPTPLPRTLLKDVVGRDRKPDASIGYTILIFDFR